MYARRVPTTVTAADSTRTRLLDAASVVLAHYGPRKLSLTDIATHAGVSRPTLYRHFASKQDLLVALATHERQRFESELAAAVHGLAGSARLDRALRFVVEFQHDYPMRGLIATEPAFMLEQLEWALRTMTPSLGSLFGQPPPVAHLGPLPTADLADLIVRIAFSHFLIRGDDAQLLRQLRHVAGTST